MMDNEILLIQSTEHRVDGFEEIISLAEKLDFLDIQLLRKFYITGKQHPFDCQPYCFPILYNEMKTAHKMKVGVEALRKRLSNLVKLNLLVKIKASNPTNYGPVRDKSDFVRGIITKFFSIHGLNKFL